MDNRTLSTAEIYDLFASSYRSYSNSKRLYINAVDEQILSIFPHEIDCVLDFGSGDGVRGAQLVSKLKVKSFYQADISKEMIKRCKAIGAAKDVLLTSDVNWYKNLPPLDAVFCLWNVLGHINGTDERVQVLRLLCQLLKPGGKIVVDVNNRHNVEYGWIRSVVRRGLDKVFPNYKRGDVTFEWSIGDKKFPANGHFFTEAEVRYLAKFAGLEILSIRAVSYKHGVFSDNLNFGQLFIELVKKE
jgi:SAM-dependent methyltransferase